MAWPKLPAEAEGYNLNHEVIVSKRCPKCRKFCDIGFLDGAIGLPVAYHINNLLELDALINCKRTNDSHTECPEHEKPRVVFCETCEELICYICSYAEKHNDHIKGLADVLFEKHKLELGECLQPLKDKIEGLKQMLTAFDDAEKRIQKQGEMAKKEIQVAIQLHMNKLGELMSALQKSRESLLNQAEAATRQKLHLHWLEKEGLEMLLAQLTSCQEFVEKGLGSQTQCLTHKRKMVQHINETHSKVKVSELQPPGQRADIAFLQNHIALSVYTLPDVGSVQSTVNYQSVPGLFSVDLPQCVARETTEVTLITSLPLLSAKVLHCSLKLGDTFSSNCSVVQVDNGHFNVMLAPEQPGLHMLSVHIGELEGNAHGSLFEVPVISIAEWREQRLRTFVNGLRHPHGVAVSDDGRHVIVTESQRNCVTVFSTATGEVVTRFGRHGNRPGELENPREVAVSADGHIFVSDNNQIHKFTLSGHHKDSLSRIVDQQDILAMAWLSSHAMGVYLPVLLAKRWLFTE